MLHRCSTIGHRAPCRRADQGCAGAELTSYFFPPEFDSDYLLKLKRHAYLRGVAISGTAVGNVFTHPEGPARRKEIESVNDWIRHAAIMGAPHIRVFAGVGRDPRVPSISGVGRSSE